MAEVIALNHEIALSNPKVASFVQALETKHLARNCSIAVGEHCIAFSTSLGFMRLSQKPVEDIQEALLEADFDLTKSDILYVAPGRIPKTITDLFSTFVYGIAIFPGASVTTRTPKKTFEQQLTTTIFDGNQRIRNLVRVTEKGLQEIGSKDVRLHLRFGAGTIVVAMTKNQ